MIALRERVYSDWSNVPPGVRLVAVALLALTQPIIWREGLGILLVVAIPTLPVLLTRSGATFEPAARAIVSWKGLGVGGPFYVPWSWQLIPVEPSMSLRYEWVSSGWSSGHQKFSRNNWPLLQRFDGRLALTLIAADGQSWRVGGWFWRWFAERETRRIADALGLRIVDARRRG